MVEILNRRPKTVAEINPDGVRRFGRRKCETCRRSIMDHYILPFKNNELRSRQYCYRDATQYSGGMQSGY